MRKHLLKLFFPLLLINFLFFAVTYNVFANTVTITDNAGVFNSSDISQIQNEAQNILYPVRIMTTVKFNGSKTNFIQQASQFVQSDNQIVIAIDVRHHYLTIGGGSQVDFPTNSVTDAKAAFSNRYNNGDYAGATVAALQSLSISMGNHNAEPNAQGTSGVNNQGFPIGLLCLVGFFVLAIIVLGLVFFAKRKRNTSERFEGPSTPYYTPSQPSYSEDDGPIYRHEVNNYPTYRQGINPLVAGGLGAAGGGLVGCRAIGNGRMPLPSRFVPGAGCAPVTLGISKVVVYISRHANAI